MLEALRATLHEDPEGVLVVGTESDPNAPVGTGPTEKVTTSLAAGIDPLTEFTASRPDVATLDFSDVYCPEGTCHSVIGNVMVYLDRNHITQTYSRTMLPQIEERLLRAWDALGGLNR